MPNEKSGAKNHNVICFWSWYFSFSGTGSIILKGLKVATVVIFQTNQRSYKKGVLHKCFQKTEAKSGLSMNLSVTFLDFTWLNTALGGYIWPWSKSPLLDPKLLQGWFQHQALQRGDAQEGLLGWEHNLCVRRCLLVWVWGNGTLSLHWLEFHFPYEGLFSIFKKIKTVYENWMILQVHCVLPFWF